MSERTPQQMGRDWEPEFAKSVGGKPVKNSGAGFKKGDVIGPTTQDMTFLWSLKWRANHKSVRIEDEWMVELLHAINGPGGYGGAMIPAIATKTEGFELVTMRKQDALMLMTEVPDLSQLRKPSRGSRDRYAMPHHHKRVPELLRGTQED